jgi:hypothetical protein
MVLLLTERIPPARRGPGSDLWRNAYPIDPAPICFFAERPGQVPGTPKLDFGE